MWQETALHLAVKHGHESIVKHLLEIGADIHATDHVRSYRLACDSHVFVVSDLDLDGTLLYIDLINLILLLLYTACIDYIVVLFCLIFSSIYALFFTLFLKLVTLT